MKATKKANGNGKAKKERPGVQVVLRVPADLKATMVKAAREAGISANQAWIVRCTTGAMPKPQQKKEAKS